MQNKKKKIFKKIYDYFYKILEKTCKWKSNNIFKTSTRFIWLYHCFFLILTSTKKKERKEDLSLEKHLLLKRNLKKHKQNEI